MIVTAFEYELILAYAYEKDYAAWELPEIYHPNGTQKSGDFHIDDAHVKAALPHMMVDVEEIYHPEGYLPSRRLFERVLMELKDDQQFMN